MNELIKNTEGKFTHLSSEELIYIEKHKKLSKKAFSENTKRARKKDMKIFESWCDENNLSSLPALESTIIDFIDVQAKTKKFHTIKRYLSTITSAHEAVKLKTPVKDELVSLAMKGISNELGTRQKQAAPLNFPQMNQALQSLGDSPRSLLDKALICVSYDTLCRRSETTNIRVEDIEFDNDGSAVVLIVKSKTDQTGDGAMKYLSHTSVEHLNKWLEFAKITEGFIFRGLDRWDHVLKKPLSGDGVSRSFRRIAQKTGLDMRGISGHSTRIGACQDLVANGIDLTSIQQAGSWTSAEMVARYSEKQHVKRGGMAQLSAIQGR